MNLYAKQLLIVLYRKSNHAEKALSEIEKNDRTVAIATLGSI